MKKFLSLTLALATLSATCFAEVANTPLSQQINKVLTSDEYCIRFQHQGGGVSSNSDLAQNAFAKQPSKLVEMLAKKGDSKIITTEMYTDDNMLFSASFDLVKAQNRYTGHGSLVNGDVPLEKINQNPSEVRKYVNFFSKLSGNTAMYGSNMNMLERTFLGYFPAFVTLEPSKEYWRLQDGTMQLRDSQPFCHCVHYSKSGTQTVDEKAYQFEEYVSDAKDGINEVCRYYFLNGELCKLVHTYSNIDGGVEATMDKVLKGGSYTVDQTIVIDIYKFGLTTDDALVAAPSKSKIMKGMFKW